MTHGRPIGGCADERSLLDGWSSVRRGNDCPRVRQVPRDRLASPSHADEPAGVSQRLELLRLSFVEWDSAPSTVARMPIMTIRHLWLVAPKSAGPVRPRSRLGSLLGDRSHPSVRDGAGAHHACLEALYAGRGAHRLRRADELRSGGAGWEDPVSGGWLRLTRLLVVVAVGDDLYGLVHGRAGHEYDGRGADAAVALGGRADLVRVGTRGERHPGVAVEGAGDAAAVGEQQRDV